MIYVVHIERMKLFEVLIRRYKEDLKKMKCLSSDCFQTAWQWRRASAWCEKSELMKVSVARGEGTGRCWAAQPPSQPRIKHLSLSRCEETRGDEEEDYHQPWLST